MRSPETRPKVVLVTNMLPPYRVSFYRALAQRVDLTVLLDTLSEFNRQWEVPLDDLGFDVVVMNSRSFLFTRRHRTTGYVEKRQFHFSEKALQHLARLRPDVVLSVEFGLRSLFSMIHAKFHGIPFILLSEGTPHTEGWVGWRKKWLRHLLVGQADRFWTNGPESSKLLMDYGGRRECMDEGMTGIATRELRSKVEAVMSERDGLRDSLGLKGRVFLFAASLTERKGLDPMLAAFAGVRRRADCPPFSLIVAGGGNLDSRLEEWRREHPDVPVHAPGFLQPDQLVPLFAAADWGILPTLDDNWPLATLETVVAGLPQMFSCYNGATADLCEDGVTGHVVDPLDPESFEEGVWRALHAPVARVPAASAERIADYYSPEEQAARGEASIRKAWQTFLEAGSAADVRTAFSPPKPIKRRHLARLCRWAASRFGRRICDWRTGEEICRVWLVRWGGRLLLVGVPDGMAVRVRFAPQKRTTFWNQQIVFEKVEAPDFKNEAAEMP